MNLREQNLEALDGGHVDVLIVGAGINGAVSAAALAARGVSVAVIDRADVASGISQESSNLVWGGFTYLKNYEIPLVWKLCRSRNALMKAYPDTITEVSFLATLDESSPYPSWLAGLGSLAYWGLGRFATKRPRYLRRSSIGRNEPIVSTETAGGAIEYRDAYLRGNDARFVWSLIRSALDSGAIAANYVSLDGAERRGDRWHVELHDKVGDRTLTATATTIVNAAGPFVDHLNQQWGTETAHRVVYSKGIHLVVPRLTPSERILAFFDDTQRLFYVIPMAHRSVIGTTDTRTPDPDEEVTEADRKFLLAQINARLDLSEPLTTDDVIAERCGVRALVVENEGDDQTDTDWTSLSRKHVVEVDDESRIVTIFGGKLTDCLNVGDEVADAVAELGVRPSRPPRSEPWYGEPPAERRQAFLTAAAAVGLDRPTEVERAATVAEVVWARHGETAFELLDRIKDDPSLAEPALAASDVTRAELALFAEREMIVHLDDFLRRRTKLALIHRAEDLAADPGMAELTSTLGLA